MSVQRLAVIGAGTMGAGIAELAATAGCRVWLVDINAEVLNRGIEGITSRLSRRVDKGRLPPGDADAIRGRIVTGSRIDEIGEAQIAIEAVVEKMTIKQGVFRELDKMLPHDAVLATNTSSLRVTEIASGVEHADRVVGMHFFNPAPVMPLVEIIAADRSGAASLDTAFDAAKSWGKVPVRAKDTPGFIVNRVARGFYLEALRMLGEGIAGVEVIDSAMRDLGGFRMGPFQLMDLVGLDVNYAVSCSVWEQSGKPARLTPHDIQRRLVEQERLGRKSGRGFYRYDSDPPTADHDIVTVDSAAGENLTDKLSRFAIAAASDAERAEHASPTHRYAFARILATIMNEAVLTLADQVATEADIDTAMEKGTNYPTGPLQWARNVGFHRVAQCLESLNHRTNDDRFRPASLFFE